MGKLVLVFMSAGIFLMLTMLGDGGSCSTKEKRSNKTTVNRNDRLATGVWGGQHIRAEVRENGAEIEFDCAHGKIEEAIVTDGAGNFDVKGKFSPERGGPVRQGEEDNGRSVHYVGQVKGEQLTLTISDVNAKETIGTFTLTHGSDGRIMKCR